MFIADLFIMLPNWKQLRQKNGETYFGMSIQWNTIPTNSTATQNDMHESQKSSTRSQIQRKPEVTLHDSIYVKF